MLNLNFLTRFFSGKNKKQKVMPIKNVGKRVVVKRKKVDDIKSKKEKEPNEDKRKFLKMAGVAGVGLLASQLLPQKADALIMGGTPSSNVVGMKNIANTRIDPATETTLTLVKNQTTKLTFDGSNNLYVNSATGFASQIENSSNAIINPATEDTLLAIKNQASKIGDTTGSQINPATDDMLFYLRRMVKLMESQAVVDSGNRQRVTLDSLGTGTAVTTTVPVSGTVTATANLQAGTNIVGGVTIDSQGRQMFTDFARQAYNSGIRSNLTFS